MDEFNIIKNFFSSQKKTSENIITHIGDDAAIVSAPDGLQLAITTDTLNSGIHFPKTTSAFDIGFKSLAVNLSDLAAMGATPAWVTLSISLENSDENWLKNFAQGFFELANRYQVQLIGGDTNQGPLSITIQAIGFIDASHALLRKNAKVGDLIFVSNTLGDAGVGLQISQNKLQVDAKYQETFLNKLNRPQPQVELGKKLLGISKCAIDISDGLISDLNHLLVESNVGAEINLEKLPLSEAMSQSFEFNDAIKFALASGDDYELCFTVSEDKVDLLSEFNCTCIGKITASKRLELFLNGKPYQENLHGFQHFS